MAAMSAGGKIMSALRLDKTRTPIGGVRSGAEWPITPGQNREISFVAGDPGRADVGGIDEARENLRALLADGPKTVHELGADSGNKRRALEDLRNSGEIIAAEKKGRAQLWRLSDFASGDLELDV